MRSRPKTALLERLERRAMLSAAPNPADLAAAGFVPVTWNGNETYAKPGRWIARFDGVAGKASRQLADVNARLAGRAGFKAAKHLGQDGLVLIDAPKGKMHAEVQQSLKGLRGLKRLEPDLLVSIDATPNDASYGQLWGLHNTGQSSGLADADIDAPEAWALSTGNPSLVTAVIDTGVLHTHPDLAGNMWKNPGETAGDGIDNDGNGFVDDVFGYDFVNDDGDPTDDHGHGTHVAGTIAAVGDNGIGVAGVNWAGKVMALKFLPASGYGTTADAIRAVNYATTMKTNYGVDVRVTNNSWGGGDYSQALFDAIRRSGDAGILFVAAAGNGGDDGVGDDNDAPGEGHYPSNYNLNNVISVAATDRNDAKAGFSNFGATTVDLAAPGVAILSTYRNNGYGALSGTSMAAPHVAGVASLAFGYNPGATAAEVKSAILAGAEPIAAMSGRSVTGGRLNAMRTLERLPLPGDVNGDGTANLADFNIIAINFGRTEGALRTTGDVTGDGKVDLKDFNLLASHFGETRAPIV